MGLLALVNHGGSNGGTSAGSGSDGGESSGVDSDGGTSSGGGSDGGSDDGSSDGGSADDGGSSEGVSTAERVAMVVSVALTVALFSFVAWNAVAGGGQAQPQVTVDDRPSDDRRTVHAVQISNPGDRGFERVTVLVACGDPPREVVVDYLPPRSAQTTTVACPNGVTDPPASVLSWQRG